MNSIFKTIAVGLACFVLMGSVASAQPRHERHHKHGANMPPTIQTRELASGTQPLVPVAVGQPVPDSAQDRPMRRGPRAADITATKIVYLHNGLVLIDSVDNAIDWLVFQDDSLHRAARYQVDAYKGRYDVKSIMRPQSVQVIGHHVVFLASSLDSCYLGVLSMLPPACDGEAMQLVAGVGSRFHADAFTFDPMQRKLIVTGFNASGYDISIFDLSDGLERLSSAPSQLYHYHVPKQSERIKASDPYGVGLTIVAVVVVFFALICIALVLKSFAKIIAYIQKRKDQSEFTRKLSYAVTASDNDVYAAIAAAICLYEEDMHDEEDAILTIQKVERAWTPWNAKFYNMNQYFNRKGR